MTLKKEDLQDIYPLTPMQEGMLFHARIDSDDPAYTEQVVSRIRGPLNVALYQAAWDDIHARYAPLRSVFIHEKTREPLQLIAKQRSADFAYTSLLQAPPAEQTILLQQARDEERQRGFTLSRGPLLRVRVYQLAADEHQIILTWHHIVLDGWSTHLMLDDLARIYAAKVRGVEANLPPLPSHAAYVEWIKGRDQAASLAWWRNTLDGVDTIAEIPKLASTGDESFQLAKHDLRLAADTLQGLQQFAAQQQATLSSLVQTVWGLVLARYVDTRDVVFGAVVSGRSPEIADIARLPGLLINTIPVRVSYSADDSFGSVLQRVQAQSLAAQAHQFSRLADIQNETPLRGELIKHLVVFENYPVATPDDSGNPLSVEVLESAEPTSYDLILVVDPASGLRLELQYNANAYDRSQVERLLQHVHTLLLAARQQPQARVNQLDMLSSDETAYLTQTLNATARDYPSASNLAMQFQLAADRHAERTALVWGDKRLSYAELERRSNQLAHVLAERGVCGGDRVLTLLDRSPDMVIAMLALAKLGASYVPQDPATPAERLSFIIGDASIRAIIVQAAAGLRLPDLPQIHPDADAATIAAAPSTAPSAQISPEQEIYLVYTSGSTGQPKAVAVPHRAVLRLVCNSDYVTLGVDDRVAHLSNVAFDASTFEVWGPLLNGSELHILDKDTSLTPNALTRELRSRKISVLFLTTALFNQVAREVPDAFSTLGTLLFGGELVDTQWVKRVLERGAPQRLVHLYGPTETTTFATWHLVQGIPAQGTVPIGRPIANTTLYVVDQDQRPQPLGALGEILIGGDGVALSYHQRPELSAEKFIANPFGTGRLYRTGDLGRLNRHGDLEFVGRRDHQVKLRGFRIELGEIETALRSAPEVNEALVIVHRDDTTNDRKLVAYLTMRSVPDKNIDLTLRNYLQQHLPSYMLPSAFVILERFPLNANGKIARNELPAPSRAGTGFGKTYVAPANDLEAKLAAIWQSVLNVENVSRNDSFFELGGHSLTATTAIAHIRAELKVNVSMPFFFECPRLSALAEEIARLQAEIAEKPTGITRVAREVYRGEGG